MCLITYLGSQAHRLWKIKSNLPCWLLMLVPPWYGTIDVILRDQKHVTKLGAMHCPKPDARSIAPIQSENAADGDIDIGTVWFRFESVDYMMWTPYLHPPQESSQARIQKDWVFVALAYPSDLYAWVIAEKLTIEVFKSRLTLQSSEIGWSQRKSTINDKYCQV